MRFKTRFLNCAVATILSVSLFSLQVSAQDAALEGLLSELSSAQEDDARRIAAEIELKWAQSGSSTADLLLKRGNDALEIGEIGRAIEHYTALTDHAPEFAEGWHRRAIAYAEAELFGPAIADLEHAIAIEPRHYNAIASLGGILQRVNRYDMAKEAYQQVLLIHPHHKDVQAALEAVELEIGGSEL